jgi:sporulation protein YlmC with PRC-barrel domain
MTSKFLLSTAFSALMISGAMAQTPTAPSPNSSSNPPVVAPAAPGMNKPATQMPNPAANAGATKQSLNAGSKVDVVASQRPDQWLASKFKGTEVVGANNKKIGTISDILFDQTGKIDAYVVSFGGFLGVGEKEVAIAPASFQVVPGTNGGAKKLQVAMNPKELQRAQKFAAYEPPKPTASHGGGAGGMAGGGLISHAPPASTKVN